MSIFDLTAWACGRSALVSVLALTIAAPLARWIGSLRGFRHSFAWLLLISPALTPPLLTGYAWSRELLTLTLRPGWNELLYGAALLLRMVPFAALILYFLPSPLSAQAKHVYRLLHPAAATLGITPRWRETWKCSQFQRRSRGSGPGLALAMVFLLSFSEFELASMWGLKTWTVAIFDAQAGGLPVAATLRLAATPFTVLALGLGVFLLRAFFSPSKGSVPFSGAAIPFSGAAKESVPFSGAPIQSARGLAHSTWLYLVGAAALVVAGPLWVVGGQALDGLRSGASVFGSGVMLRDIAASVFFATGAAAAAQGAAAWGARNRLGICLLGAPGLPGALTVALLVLVSFQSGWLRWAYDTPVPLLIALTVLLLPVALALRLMCDLTADGPALHLARLYNNSRLIWHLDKRRRWWSGFLLFCWAYFEFTASSLLAPVGMTPVLQRLYNLAHYGQTSLLSLMLCLALAVPGLVLLLTAIGLRLYARARGE